jgi:hypothetical protein
MRNGCTESCSYLTDDLWEARVEAGFDDELVTAGEIAGRLGLKDGQVVLDLCRHRVAFPGPVGRRSRALVWSWNDVELWAVRYADVATGALGTTLTRFLDRVA